MPSSRPKVDNVRTDRALLEIWRRLDSLERTVSGDTTNIFNNITVNNPSQPESGLVLFNGTNLTLSTARRWLSAGDTTVFTTLANAAFHCIPPGFNRITAMSLVQSVPGAGAGVTQTYRVTLGTATTETDTNLFMTLPVSFMGTNIAQASVACSAGQALRVAVNRSAATGSQVGACRLLLTLER